MLKLYDKKHNAIGHIVKYKDCRTESDVDTGDKSLSFVYLAKYHSIENEMYIRTRTDEYVVKEISESSDGFPQITAALNLEEMEAKPWQTFSVTDSTVDEAARLALAGTGWTIGQCDVLKRRNAGIVRVNSLGVIRHLCDAFTCDPVFDTVRKTVSFYEMRGTDKGVYFIRGLNLRKLQRKTSSYDFYTRIVPVGADGLTIESVNGGKNYLENFQYSDKVRTYIWEDSSYTDARALMEDAEKKLDDLSKPEKSYSADVRDLARQKPGYSVLSYGLGDTVTLIDADTGTREKQRIKKMVEYEADPGKNSCELGNTFRTFEELQDKLRAAADIVNHAMTDDGRIYVSDILNFEKGIASSVTVSGILENVSGTQSSIAYIQDDISSMQGDLSRVKLTLGQVETNYLNADEAAVKYATIENLAATNETVHSIQGDYAAFKSVTADEFASHTARIDKIINEELVTAKGWMLEGAIGDAQISKVSANKLDSGTVNTVVVTIAGTDGRMQISDNTIQIRDADRVRVQAGKDASGDYTLAVWDASGKLIWDALGATEDTIQRKIIRDRMVADDAAIQAPKIDFRSFDTVLTQQGVTISGTVVQVGSKTLNVVLSEQTQAVTDQGETLKDHAAKITANEKAVALRVTTQEFSTYKSETDNGLASAKERLTTAESGITAMQGQIALKVEQTDIDKSLEGYSTTAQMNAEISLSQTGILNTVASAYATKDSLQETSTVAAQTADKFTWIVKSGTSATDFTLTERTAQLVTESLTIKDQTGTATVISGGKMDIDQIFAQDVTATGTIRGANLIGATGTFEGDVTTSNIIASGGTIGQWAITDEGITKSIGDYDVHVLPGTNGHKDFLVVKDRVTGKWPFYVHADGELYSEKLTAINASIYGNISADTLTVYEKINLHGTNWFGQTGDHTVIFLSAGAEHFAPNIHFGNGSYKTVIDGTGVTVEAGSLSTGYGCDVSMYSACISSLTATDINGVRSVEVETTYISFENYEYSMAFYFNSGAPCIRPSSVDDAVWDIGQSWARFRTIYASSGMNTASDERDKDITGTLDERYKNLFMELKPVTFRLRNCHDEKIHFGLGAQTTEKSARQCGIRADEIAAVEHCFWDEPDNKGRTDRYGIAYDEIHMLTIPVVQEHERLLASHDRHILETEARVSAGESRIGSLQEQLVLAREQIAALGAEVAQQSAMIARIQAA